MSKLYPDSTQTVKNIYNFVTNQLSINNLFSMEFTNYKSKQQLVWECNCIVSWPTKESFRGEGLNKVSASADAALKCLYWLHKQNKLNGNKPIIYTKEEIETKFDKPVPIYLNFEILKEVERLLQIYKKVSFYIIYIYEIIKL